MHTRARFLALGISIPRPHLATYLVAASTRTTVPLTAIAALMLTTGFTMSCDVPASDADGLNRGIGIGGRLRSGLGDLNDLPVAVLGYFPYECAASNGRELANHEGAPIGHLRGRDEPSDLAKRRHSPEKSMDCPGSSVGRARD